MKNSTKVALFTLACGLVAGALALAQHFPADRVLIAAGIGALLGFALMMMLKFRP